MQAHDYADHVFDIVHDLKEEFEKRGGIPRFSDIFDAEGNQYVNIVQEGGGVLGLALVGFTYVLEEMNLRFLSLGGTSAGSINALLLADAGHPHEKRSLRVLERVEAMDFTEFVDGGDDARDFLRALGKGSTFAKVFHFGRNVRELVTTMGINPGTTFETWLRDNLNHSTWAELRRNLTQPTVPLVLKDRYGRKLRDLEGDELNVKLAIVAADVTTQTKVEFPRMASLYYADPDGTHPANFVRASMSIPGFFEPQHVDMSWARATPEVTRRQRAAWADQADYKGPIPPEILFVDGGIMSNFPIDLLHREGTIPNRPTFGVKLGHDRREYSKTSGFVSFLGTLFDGVRNLRDHEFLVSNPQYRDVTSYINVDGFDWLDFAISDENKKKLFAAGARAAAQFLRNFSWVRYKRDIRNGLVQTVKPLVWELSSSRTMQDKLKAFDIEEGSDLYRKIMFLRNRQDGYRALWIDDSFTYVLPVAILESLNINTSLVQTTDDAFTLLNAYNTPALAEGKSPQRFDLVLSDASRKVRGQRDGLAGIRFAQNLLDQGFRDLPVIIYAHTRTGLENRYREESGDEDVRLPANIANTDNGDNTRHHNFIREVVDCLYSINCTDEDEWV